MKKILFIILSLSSIIGNAQKLDAQLKSEKEIIDEFSKANNNAGVLVLIGRDDNIFTYTSGYSNLEKKTPVNENDLFEIGSASKIFTAIAILQLIEEGQLSLKTKLNTIYPKENITSLANYKGTNYWEQATVEMLLNHTSGFIDYLNIYESDEEALKVFGNSNKDYAFDEIIKLAIDHGDANFVPGKMFKYSNTNYIILGDIISKISKMPWRTYIEKNIFEKAGLKMTFFGSRMSPENKKMLISGYYGTQVTTMPYTLAGSAGEIVSNIYDLRKLLIYWAKGKFYKSPETFKKQISTGLHNMFPQTDTYKYALGAMIISETAGHGGQTFGFQSYLAINPKTKDVYVIGINNANVASMQLFFELNKKN
ncbi:beta-lactamase family protein [Flavobacteriaceae bacterium]|nr:beta-lactamase family protein [Flavobacteriaceae bacterium]